MLTAAAFIAAYAAKRILFFNMDSFVDIIEKNGIKKNSSKF